jgi:hypothetical protein
MRHPEQQRFPRGVGPHPAVAASTAGYAVGSKVTHPMFGDGTVTAFDAKKLNIEFGDGRVKQILNGYVKRRALR